MMRRWSCGQLIMKQDFSTLEERELLNGRKRMPIPNYLILHIIKYVEDDPLMAFHMSDIPDDPEIRCLYYFVLTY